MSTEHSRSEVHGFDVVSTTHTDPAYSCGPYVWVGHGCEGRSLRPQQARELAAAILAAANVFDAPTPPEPLRRLAQRVANLNPACAEIGAGMLASLVDDATRALASEQVAA